MSHGRSIRIYLADGSAAGIRHAEVVNWTGQAIDCPRARLVELNGWVEAQRPGVYLLVGDDPDATRPLVYIGESESVRDRLITHREKPPFDWVRVVLLTSKDGNLTKAHVKYLESRFVELARAFDRVKVHNTTTPTRSSLPRADSDAMEEFLGHARLLLAALGYLALEPSSRSEADPVGPTGPYANVELRFVLQKRGIDATGYLTDAGFVVKSGSKGDLNVRENLSKGWRAQREALIADGSIVKLENAIQFAKDVSFSAPSAAAAVLSGGVENGRTAWKTADGTTLADLEAQRAKEPAVAAE